jgi:hypothetical protein
MANNAALDIDRPEQFLTLERRVQRFGAGAMTIFLIVGALGGFGDGPLSHTSARAGPIDAHYQRFARASYRTALTISVDTVARNGDPVSLSIARELIDHVAVLETRPADAQKRADAAVAVFEVPAMNGKAHLELRYEPDSFGFRRISITAEGHTLQVWQLVYF